MNNLTNTIVNETKQMLDSVDESVCASFDNDDQRAAYHMGVLNTLSALEALLDENEGCYFEEAVNTTYTPIETIEELRGKAKCPHCGESYYVIDYLTETLLYLPTIFKDGTCISGDGNVTTTHCTCLNCGKSFSY